MAERGTGGALPLASDRSLVCVDPKSQEVRRLDQGWFNADAYDLGYQGLTECIQRPAGNGFIVSVQRSSTLVLLDHEGRSVAGEIALLDRGGNPELHFLSASVLLATDYDTLVEISFPEGRVCRAVRLQDGEGQFGQQFVGEPGVTGDGRHVLVPRPFSKDVLLFDVSNFTVRRRAEAPFQPLTACALDEERFVCRDWKTGKSYIAAWPTA